MRDAPVYHLRVIPLRPAIHEARADATGAAPGVQQGLCARFFVRSCHCFELVFVEVSDDDASNQQQLPSPRSLYRLNCQLGATCDRTIYTMSSRQPLKKRCGPYIDNDRSCCLCA